MIAIEVGHIAQAVDQRFTGGDDVADHQGAVRHHGELAVLDLKPCHFTVNKHTLAREEADIMHADMLFIAALLQRIVQSAAENGKNIGAGDLFLLLEIVHHL